MVRTQIQLTDEQAKRIKQVASQTGVSMAELIRRGVEKVLSDVPEPSPDELVRRAIAAAGKFHSLTRDAAIHHDDYLSDAFK